MSVIHKVAKKVFFIFWGKIFAGITTNSSLKQFKSQDFLIPRMDAPY